MTLTSLVWRHQWWHSPAFLSIFIYIFYFTCSDSPSTFPTVSPLPSWCDFFQAPSPSGGPLSAAARGNSAAGRTAAAHSATVCDCAGCWSLHCLSCIHQYCGRYFSSAHTRAVQFGTKINYLWKLSFFIVIICFFLITLKTQCNKWFEIVYFLAIPNTFSILERKSNCKSSLSLVKWNYFQSSSPDKDESKDYQSENLTATKLDLRMKRLFMKYMKFLYLRINWKYYFSYG